nr:MAG TPA: hypothetical protein [Caudoviricetes sp.]
MRFIINNSTGNGTRPPQQQAHQQSHGSGDSI